MENNYLLHKFIKTLFPKGFSKDTMEYGVVVFKSNVGLGVSKIGDNATATSIEINPQQIIDIVQAKDGNEVLLIHSQPMANLEIYPTDDDKMLYNSIITLLENNNIEIYNNCIISNDQCTSFKDVGIIDNFK